MSPGEQLLRQLPLKREFRDSHERRAYLRSVEIARRLVDDPSLLKAGKSFLERFVRSDPAQKDAYVLWCDALEWDVHTIAERMLSDDERGARLRESAPVFTVITAPQARCIFTQGAA